MLLLLLLSLLLVVVVVVTVVVVVSLVVEGQGKVFTRASHTKPPTTLALIRTSAMLTGADQGGGQGARRSRSRVGAGARPGGRADAGRAAVRS